MSVEKFKVYEARSYFGNAFGDDVYAYLVSQVGASKANDISTKLEKQDSMIDELDLEQKSNQKIANWMDSYSIETLDDFSDSERALLKIATGNLKSVVQEIVNMLP